jgi:hypothetical protein
LLEVAAIDFVHGREVAHVFEENRAAQDFVQAAAGGLQDGRDVFQHLLGCIRVSL